MRTTGTDTQLMQVPRQQLQTGVADPRTDHHNATTSAAITTAALTTAPVANNRYPENDHTSQRRRKI